MAADGTAGDQPQSTEIQYCNLLQLHFRQDSNEHQCNYRPDAVLQLNHRKVCVDWEQDSHKYSSYTLLVGLGTNLKENKIR